ncbi:MAG: glycosyl hydrolase [Acidobacteria bacterium]|nr:glycosyl hydrolase [Acidobacteriota bacterium]
MLRISILLIAGILIFLAQDSHWVEQSSGTTARFRGVVAVDEHVAWASGTKGTVVRTIDGGIKWQVIAVTGAGDLDFRDIEAIDADTAWTLSIGPGEASRIYKTDDGGKTWALQFKNDNPKAFFDAIAFWDANNGLAFSDPVDGRLVIIRTSDGGTTWKPVPLDKIPPAIEGEGAFAASGTCLIIQGKTNAWIATGGAARARVFRSTDRGASWQVADTPIRTGNSAAGIFSIAFKDELNGIVVGGDYRQEKIAVDNIALTSDGGRTWRLAKNSGLGGYRSAVTWVDRSKLVAVGPSGSDFSNNGGATWSPIGQTGFHAFSFSKTGQAGWAVGDDGRIAKYAGR